MTPRPILIVTVALAALALAGTGNAAGTKSCWHTIATDWNADGRIDGHYSVGCYRAALRDLPEDLRDYTSLGDQIEAALAAALRGNPGDGGGTDGTSGGSTNGTTGNAATNESARSTQGVDPSPKAASGSIDKIGADNAQRVPLPLLILGGVALALVAAGGAGFAARKIRARRVTPAA